MGRSTSSNLGVVKDESAETSTTKAPKRTPAEIAQANLDDTNAKLEKVQARKTRLTTDLQRAEGQISDLEKLRDYQASHPALVTPDNVEEAVEDGALATQDV